jgi:dihydrofolate reductase
MLIHRLNRIPGLIDEYEFVVQPRLVGHGPTLFAGLSKRIDLRLVSRLEFGSGRWRCGMRREGSYRFTRARGRFK